MVDFTKSYGRDLIFGFDRAWKAGVEDVQTAMSIAIRFALDQLHLRLQEEYKAYSGRPPELPVPEALAAANYDIPTSPGPNPDADPANDANDANDFTSEGAPPPDA